MTQSIAWPEKTASPVRTHWRGHSGRDYELHHEPLASFHMHDDALYLLLAGERALWVGSADDVIADSASRTRFKSALKACSAVYSYSAPMDAVDKMTTSWDLANGHMARHLHLATAS